MRVGRFVERARTVLYAVLGVARISRSVPRCGHRKLKRERKKPIMATEQLMRVAMLLAVASATSGCSFALVKGPPEDGVAVEGGEGGCTTSNFVPIMDLAGAAGGVVLAANPPEGASVGPSVLGQQVAGTEDKTMVRVAFAASAAAYVASSVTGFKRTAACRRVTASEQAIRDHLRNLAAVRQQAEGSSAVRASSGPKP